MKPEITERVEKIRKGEVPEGYKATKVGIIPVEWEVKKLGDIADIDPDNLSNSTNPEYSFQYISLEDVDCGTLRNTTEILFKNAPSRARRVVRKDDILLSTVRPNLKSHLLLKKEVSNWICSTGFSVVRSKENIAHSGFVFNHLFSNVIDRQIETLIVGSNYPAINCKDVKSLLIPRPSKCNEQQKIADILSTWDKAIELKEKLVEEKKEFKRGLMQKLLVGKLRFKEYVKNPNLQEVKRYSILPEEWGIKKASSIFSNISKKNNGNEQLLSATQNNGVIPRDMLNGDVMSPSGDTNSYKLVEEGDFVISLRSFQGGIEYSCYQGIVSPAYTVLKNQIPICKDFYRHLFKSKLFIGRLASSVIGIRDGKQISYGDFSFMLLPYPELKEQEKIACVLNNIDNNIKLLNKELNQLKEQKKGLTQLLLTGIVRVEVD